MGTWIYDLKIEICIKKLNHCTLEKCILYVDIEDN